MKYDLQSPNFYRSRYEIARGDYGKFSNFGSEIEFSIRNPQIDVEIANRLSKILSSYSSRISFRDLKILIQRHRFGQSVKFQLKLKFFFYKILIFIRSLVMFIGARIKMG